LGRRCGILSDPSRPICESDRVKKPAGLQSWDSKPTLYGYKGGDLFGIIKNLEYLKSLGVNAIYLNPIFQAASYHRYNTYDYLQVDPMLGGNEALRELLDRCHTLGFKVILDGVFNHCGRGFFKFHDILENGENSPYLDWFYIHSFPLNAYNPDKSLGYRAWWNLAELPKFNTEASAVREFLWGVATHWLKFGIDGWRVDVPNEIDDDEFWREFCRRCREVNPEAYIVGEIWEDATRWLTGDKFDAVMNYELARAIWGLVAAETLNQDEIKKSGYCHIAPLSAEGFAETLATLTKKYRQEVFDVQLNLLGSHDTPRALTVVGEDESAYRLALLFMMTYPGVPCIYYGDEIGLKGGHDPDNRQGMPWTRRETWNKALFAYSQTLIRFRHKYAALRRGTYQELHAADGIYAFARHWQSECLITVLNVSRKEKELAISTKALPELNSDLHDLLGGHHARVENQILHSSPLPGRCGALFGHFVRAG
jgi:neopullulanase